LSAKVLLWLGTTLGSNYQFSGGLSLIEPGLCDNKCGTLQVIMRLSVFKGYFFFTCIVVSVAVEIVALAEDFQILGVAQLGTEEKIDAAINLNRTELVCQP